jgi:hypothetical protein
MGTLCGMNSPDGMPPPVTRREMLLAPLCVALALFAVHGSLVWTRSLAAGGDLVNQLLPMMISWIRNGAGWAPGTFAGHPLFADPQSGTLYPPNWLFLLGGEAAAPRVMTLLLMAHLGWAGLGTYFLSRRFVGIAGAALAAGLWMFGGVYGTRLAAGITVFVFAGAHLAWVVLGAEMLLAQRSRLRGVGALALLAGAQILAGAPQIVQITWTGAGVWLLARLISERTNPRIAAGVLGAFVGAFALGVVVAAPQLIASIEYSRLAYPRDGGDAWGYITNDSLGLRHLVHWFFPDFFQPGNSAEYWGSSIGFFDTTNWIGIPALLFGAFAIGTRKEGRTPLAALAAVAVLGLLLAPGKSSPVYRLFFEIVPTFDSFRVPARWIFWIGFPACMLAGAGADALWRAVTGGDGREYLRRWGIAGACVLVPLVLVVAMLGPILDALGLELSLGMFRDGGPAEARDVFAGAARAAVTWAIAMGALTAIVGGAMLAGRLSVKAAMVVLLIVTFVDVRRFWVPFHGAYPTEFPAEQVESVERFPVFPEPSKYIETFYPRTPVVEAIAATGGRFIFTDDVQGWTVDQFSRELILEMPVVIGLEGVRGYQQLVLKSYIEEIQQADALFRSGSRVTPFLRFESLYNRTPLDAYNVTAVMTYGHLQSPESFAAMGLGEPQRVHDGGLVLIPNPHARGWAWVAESEDWLNAEPAPASGHAAALSRDGGAESYQVSVLADGGAWLHASSPEHPGWKWRDLPSGAEAKNGRSVHLPKGEFKVSRVFEIARGGMGAAAGALAALLAALVCQVLGWRVKSEESDSGA